MNKINVEHFRGIHYHALCDMCDFTAAIRTSATFTREEVRRAVRRHVLHTGHGVTIESGKAAHYRLVKNETK